MDVTRRRACACPAAPRPAHESDERVAGATRDVSTGSKAIAASRHAATEASETPQMAASVGGPAGFAATISPEVSDSSTGNWMR